jgi:hypothetical protein
MQTKSHYVAALARHSSAPAVDTAWTQDQINVRLPGGEDHKLELLENST